MEEDCLPLHELQNSFIYFIRAFSSTALSCKSSCNRKCTGLTFSYTKPELCSFKVQAGSHKQQIPSETANSQEVRQGGKN